MDSRTPDSVPPRAASSTRAGWVRAPMDGSSPRTSWAAVAGMVIVALAIEIETEPLSERQSTLTVSEFVARF